MDEGSLVQPRAAVAQARKEGVMRVAMFSAALSTALLTASGAIAQSAGVFDKWLSQDSPQCVPVSEFQSVSTVTDLSPAQFQFVRALYIALPPVSRTLPPGDHAVMAIAGTSVMLALVDGVQACARFLAPDFIQSMLNQVGEGQNEHVGLPVTWRPSLD
jgi:hypothetical protein